MVLTRYVFFCLLLVLLQACSNLRQQSIVAVNEGGVGTMSASSERSNYTPTPRAVFELLRKANHLAAQSEWGAALRYLDQAQRMAPEEAQVYLQYGEIYLNQNRLEKASAMFKRVLTLSEEGADENETARRYLRQLN